jgi:hypothetical protein
VKRPRVTDVVLVLLCLMYFVTYLDRVNVSSAAAGFSKDFSLNKTEIGLVFSAFAYPLLASRMRPDDKFEASSAAAVAAAADLKAVS